MGLWYITDFDLMKRYLLLLLLLFCLMGCSSNKLADSMWYNATVVNNEGTWGTVVTSLYFFQDSVYAFNGVSVDDSVVIPPYLYAVGKYTYSKMSKNTYHVELEGKTNLGEPYKYSGLLNKKDLVMHLSVPGQSTNETYVCDPNVKLPNSKKNKK